MSIRLCLLTFFSLREFLIITICTRKEAWQVRRKSKVSERQVGPGGINSSYTTTCTSRVISVKRKLENGCCIHLISPHLISFSPSGSVDQRGKWEHSFAYFSTQPTTSLPLNKFQHELRKVRPHLFLEQNLA